MSIMDMLARAMGAPEPKGVLVEAAGDYVDNIDGDDDLWTPLKSGRRRDLNPIEQRKSRRISLYLWRRNPVAHRLIEQMADFVCGDGFTVTADTSAAQRVAEDIWSDPVTNLVLRHRDIVRDLSLFGELGLRAAVNEVSGRMRLGFLDVERIKSIDLDPENILVDQTLWVLDTAGAEPRPVPLYTWDDISTPGTGLWVGQGFYHGVNRLLGQERGTPDLLAIADYVDGYDQLVFNALERSGLVNAFLYDVTLKGFDDAKINEWVSRHGTAPRPGSVRAHNESEAWEVLTPNLGTSDTVALGREVKNMGLGGAGVPEAWFAQGDSVNRATLVAQGDPTYRMLKSRQDYVQAMFKWWIEVGMQHAMGKRLSNAKRPKVSVNVPDISQKDLTGVSQALPQIANALVAAIGEELVDRKSARKVFLMVAGQLGVELDEAEIEAAIEKAKAEAEVEAEIVNAETLLRNAAGLTPEGFPKPPAPPVVPAPGAVPGVEQGGPVQPFAESLDEAQHWKGKPQGFAGGGSSGGSDNPPIQPRAGGGGGGAGSVSSSAYASGGGRTLAQQKQKRLDDAARGGGGGESHRVGDVEDMTKIAKKGDVVTIKGAGFASKASGKDTVSGRVLSLTPTKLTADLGNRGALTLSNRSDRDADVIVSFG